MGADPKKRALVMTGGAARGAFMLGVVQGLVEDQELDFQVLAGVSIGALIAVNLAQCPLGPDPSGATTLALQNERLTDVVRALLPPHPWLKHWPLWGKRRRQVVREVVHQCIDLRRLPVSGRRLLAGAVDLWTGRWRLRDEKSLKLRSELFGMMSLPLLDPPVHVGEELWVDGVLRRTAPIEEVLLEGVDELYIVAGGFAPLGSTLRARGVFRAFAIALGELAYDKEIRLAHLAERTLGRPRVILIRPGKTLNGRLSLSPRDFEFALAHGREQAARACQPGHGGPLDDNDIDEALPPAIRKALSERPPGGGPFQAGDHE